MNTYGNTLHPTFGLAADGKPANVPNGHMHVEMDTGKIFLYDEEGDTWDEQPASGGGSGLPPVTSEDNGKVLGVEDGEWGPVEAPSGVFVIPLTATWASGGYKYTNNEITIKDVIDAVDAGMDVIAINDATYAPYVAYYYRLDCCYRSDSSGTIIGASLTFRGCESYSASATYLKTLFTSAGAGTLDSTISLDSVSQVIFNASGDMELTESNGNYVSSVSGDVVDKNTRFWINTQTYPYSWATNVRWFTTVSVCTDGLSSLQVIIKDELTGNLYKSETSRYATLNFVPYTP